MPDLITRRQLRRVCQDELLTQNGQLSLRAAETDGTDLNIIIEMIAAAGEELSAQLIDIAAALYLGSAEGADLDWLVLNLFSLIRRQASPALGSVNFSLTTANPTVFIIPANLELASNDRVRFITTEAVSFPAGSVGPITVRVRSILAGRTQQTDKNRIVNIVGRVTGAPTDLAVNNPLATAGADDKQRDDSFRDEAQRFWTAARRGTAKAVEAAALRTLGVMTASAFDVIDVTGRPARFGQLIITDRFTDVLADLNQSPPAYSVQSKQLAASVFAGLSDTRPIGIYIQAQMARIVMQEFTLALKFRAGADVGLVYSLARATIAGRVNEHVGGQTVVIGDPGLTPDPESLNGVLRTVPGLDPTSYVYSPAGDVVPRAQEAIRTSINLVTALSLSSDVPIIDTSNPDAVQVAA